MPPEASEIPKKYFILCFLPFTLFLEQNGPSGVRPNGQPQQDHGPDPQHWDWPHSPSAPFERTFAVFCDCDGRGIWANSQNVPNWPLAIPPLYHLLIVADSRDLAFLCFRSFANF